MTDADRLNELTGTILRIRSRLASLLAGETLECPDHDPDNGRPYSGLALGETHKCKTCSGTGRIPLDVDSLSVEEIAERVVKRLRGVELHLATYTDQA